MIRPREMIKQGKDYILKHYHRTFGDKMESQGVKEPDYVSDFKYKEGIDVEAKLRALKKYGYEQRVEEKQLKEIQKAIPMSSEKVRGLMANFGIMNLEDVPAIEEMEPEEEHSYHSSCSEVFEDDALNADFVERTISPKSVTLREKFERIRNENSMITNEQNDTAQMPPANGRGLRNASWHGR